MPYQKLLLILFAVSLCLWKIDTDWSDKALLLTITPHTLASEKDTINKIFYPFIPASK